MFYFQYVVNRVDINYSELKPFVAINFNEMSSRLELSPLRLGTNVLGIGKSLTLEISDMELSSWFMEFALCLEFGGSLLKKNLYALMSLEKMEVTDEINNQIISMDNENCPEADVRIDISLKFRHVYSGVPRTQMHQTVANGFRQ